MCLAAVAVIVTGVAGAVLTGAELEGFQHTAGGSRIDDARAHDARVEQFTSLVSDAVVLIPIPGADQLGDYAKPGYEYAWNKGIELTTGEAEDVLGGQEAKVTADADTGARQHDDRVRYNYLMLLRAGNGSRSLPGRPRTGGRVTRRSALRVLGPAVLLVLGTAACDSSEGPDLSDAVTSRLLTAEDAGGEVDRTVRSSELPGAATFCQELHVSETSLVAQAQVEDRGTVRYELDDGDEVLTGLFPSSDVEATMADLRTAVEDCVATRPDRDAGAVESLDELPEAAVGYRAWLRQDATDRVFLPVGDAVVVVEVGGSGSEPEQRVQELLPRAVERAGNA